MNLQAIDLDAAEIRTGCRTMMRLSQIAAGCLGLLVAAAYHDAGPAFAREQVETMPRVIGASISLQTRTIPAPKTPASAWPSPPAVEHRIRLTGMITSGDAERLRSILVPLGAPAAANLGGSSTTIELSSLGGNLIEGLKIGYLLKEFKVTAVVRKGDTCLSACALAFLGGNVKNAPSAASGICNVEIGGKVGFHNFWLSTDGLREVTSADPVASRLQGFHDARGGAARLIGFAAEMGVPLKFVGSLMGRAVEDVQYVQTVEQFLLLHICPIGVGRPSISRAEQANNICNHSTGWLHPATPLEAREIPARYAKRYLLERIQSNMQSAKTKGPLAAQLASGNVMRVDEETGRLYEDLRAAGVALPEIVGTTFEVGRYRAGGYETVCYVSLSAEDPDSYDVVVQAPRGLSLPLQLPPDNCRRLFLFDRYAIINRSS